MQEENLSKIYSELEKCGFRVSTDTRKDVSGSIYFALKGKNFDGNKFAHEALSKGAIAVVADDKAVVGEKVYLVDDTHKTLQTVARKYRDTFSIPIIAIGGSNGKTTSKGLVREILETKYKVHATEENLNNHFGVPLSILSMDKKAEVGIFEIGANHLGEHTMLLDILFPTIVVVTNNGMDHLEGFGSPLGARQANKEIYDWALLHKRLAFVDKNQPDLIEDSEGIERVLYPESELNFKELKTNLIGDYNMSNIYLALTIGKYFKIPIETGLLAVSRYKPSSNRSQMIKIGGNDFTLDCYNANPSSMMLSLESFLKSAPHPRGVILGDMLELGDYTDEEHRKVAGYVLEQQLDTVVFIGSNFKKVLDNSKLTYQWFLDSDQARDWFEKQNFDKYSFLLKGSRGAKVEKILGL